MSDNTPPPFDWIVHGYPDGPQSNAIRDRDEIKEYPNNFTIGNEKYNRAQSTPGNGKFLRDVLPSGTVAYTMTCTGVYPEKDTKPGPNYAAVTVFFNPEPTCLNLESFKKQLQNWFTKNVLNMFTQEPKKRFFQKIPEGSRQWKPVYTTLFSGNLDAELTESLKPVINANFMSRPTRPKVRETQAQDTTTQNGGSGAQNQPPKADNPIQPEKQDNGPRILYADSIIDGKLRGIKTTPEKYSTIWQLTETRPHSNNFIITIWPEAYHRIVANPSYLDGRDPNSQIIVDTNALLVTQPGLASYGTGYDVVKAPVVHLNNGFYASDLPDKDPIKGVTREPNGETNWVLIQNISNPNGYDIYPYEPAYKRIVSDPAKFLGGALWHGSGTNLTLEKPGIALMHSDNTLVVNTKPKINLTGPDNHNIRNSTNKNTTTEKNDTLYGDFIDDGKFSHVREKPDDDTNFVLTKQSDGKYKLSLYEPAYPRILRNPTAYLQGTDKQVLEPRKGIQIEKLGTVKAESGEFIVIDKLKVIVRDKKVLYANSFNTEKFYGVQKSPNLDPMSPSMWELTETSSGIYEVNVWPEAYPRILANGSFLEGCETQITGKNIVKVVKPGIARDDGTGKIRLETPPVVWLLDHEDENENTVQTPLTPPTPPAQTSVQTNKEKIAAYNTGTATLEKEIADLETAITQMEKDLEAKRTQLAEKRTLLEQSKQQGPAL